MDKDRRICRHCRKCAVTRPRGLCWVCYYTPGVKDLYAAQIPTSGLASRFGQDQGLTDAEILAMSVLPLGDEDAVPGPYQPESERPKLGDWRDNWGTSPEAWQLTPDTEPEAIAASQRGDVIEAMTAMGPTATVEQISDYTVLPVWTVQRRIEEIGRHETTLDNCRTEPTDQDAKKRRQG